MRFRGLNRDGERSDSVATVKDVASTVLDLAGVDHPGTAFQGRNVAPIEGTSMLPFLTGRSVSIHDDDPAPYHWRGFERKHSPGSES